MPACVHRMEVELLTVLRWTCGKHSQLAFMAELYPCSNCCCVFPLPLCHRKHSQSQAWFSVIGGITVTFILQSLLEGLSLLLSNGCSFRIYPSPSVADGFYSNQGRRHLLMQAYIHVSIHTRHFLALQTVCWTKLWCLVLSEGEREGLTAIKMSLPLHS